MSERDKNDYVLGLNFQASRGNQFLQGAQNAAALPEPKIPSPQALRNKKEEAFEQEVSNLERHMTREVVKAMHAGQSDVAIAFAPCSVDVAGEAADRLKLEIEAQGWRNAAVRMDLRGAVSGAVVSWSEP